MKNISLLKSAVRSIRILATIFAVWYLHSRGISPLSAIATVVFGTRLFSAIYSIVCFTVTAIMLVCIAGFIIF